MEPRDLDQKVQLTLLEHGKGDRKCLEYKELLVYLGCNTHELQESLHRLSCLALVGGNTNYAQAWLTELGLDSARRLPAARERERREKAEARRALRATRMEKFVWVGVGVIGTVLAQVLGYLILRYLRLL